MDIVDFLSARDFSALPLSLSVDGLSPLALYLGQGSQGLEIAIWATNQKPSNSTMQSAYKQRKNGRAAPVLVVVVHDSHAYLCGTNGDQPPVFKARDLDQAKRLCFSALNQPNRNSAIRFLSETLPSVETNLSGLSNEGLLSSHELEYGVKNRPDWNAAIEQAKIVLADSHRSPLASLGFTSRKIDNLTDLLLVDDARTALAVLLNENEVPEIGSSRFNNISPVSYALSKADKENLPWVIVAQGDCLRLYSARNTGVGRRGRTESYIECQLSILSEDNLGLLWLLFSAEALRENGSLSEILSESKRFASNVADRLRERIYDSVVPALAMGIADARQLTNPKKEDTELTYEMALLVLFRLLFVAYAEDRDLLPFKNNELYRRRSLKQKAIELADSGFQQDPLDERGDHHWIETTLLWEVISRGNAELGVPPYDGTIFSTDPSISPAGSELKKIRLINRWFEPALKALLVEELADGYAPVDFRALSVREFGTIYEGLLASELSIAECNLALDKKGVYRPAAATDSIEVGIGEIYLHDQSGARKSSGSFYTPDFAVEYLLEQSLDPAVDAHFERLSGLTDADKVEQFFDFRVADIAMGSGHFLVAAIDRIEKRFASWLDDHPIPGILRELQLLRDAAVRELGDLTDSVIIEDGQLLRRLIARKCIFGVDLNPITVQLARLSIWIHTFVPGLPLSLLDHNLLHGNALIGVGSLDEIRKKFAESSGTLFEIDVDELLGQASEPLKRLARLNDASLSDIASSRQLMNEALSKIKTTKHLCDLITAQAVSDNSKLKAFPFEDWDRVSETIEDSAELAEAQSILEPFKALHFPIMFPAVFLGKSGGFDVILGNPPWEEAVVNEDKFWARYQPGLASLKPREQELAKADLRANRVDLLTKLKEDLQSAERVRDFLHAGNFPGMGTGDPDLYKAFAWRFWFLSRFDRGYIGVVMPRSALAAKGSEDFRRELFKKVGSLQITTLQNSGRWVFDIHPQYTVALVSIAKKSEGESPKVSLRGPFISLKDFETGSRQSTHQFDVNDVLNWNESVSLPLLPKPESAEVFAQLRKSPWLSLNDPSSWRVRPDGELHATAQKDLMDFSQECPPGYWKVYKGASFDLWNPDTGEYNAWAHPDNVLPWLQKKRSAANNSSRDSVHKEFSKQYIDDQSTLMPLRPRIAFRDITNRTNTRTVVACLLPPRTFITNKGPVLMFPRGDECDEAYLLGVLCSIPLDWYARRFVETNVNFFILNAFPIPRPHRESNLWKRIVYLAGRLACPDERFSDWASKVGVDYGRLDEQDKKAMIYELDAVVAHLYGLSEEQVVHIYETFHEGWSYQDRLDQTLVHYQTWKDKS